MKYKLVYKLIYSKFSFYQFNITVWAVKVLYSLLVLVILLSPDSYLEMCLYSLVCVNSVDRVERWEFIPLIAEVERVVDVRIKSRGYLVNQKLSELCLWCWR